jgi:hypothetical protein
MWHGYGRGVFRSTNNGNSWTMVSAGISNTYFLSIAVIGQNIFAGTSDQGIFRSTDEGNSWASVNNGIESMTIYDLEICKSNLFTVAGEIFISSNNGMSWSNISNGMLLATIYRVAFNDSFIFAGTLSPIHTGYSPGVYRRPLSEIISTVPVHTFSLYQNYPNPFNPITKIEFELSATSFTALEIFDLLGRKITSLVTEGLHSGHHTKLWNASEYPSGVYFYRLQSGGFSETKKLILQK